MKLKVFKTYIFIPDEMPFPKIYWKYRNLVILVFGCLVYVHM